MERIQVLLFTVALVSISLSSLTLWWTWILQQKPPEPMSWDYMVKADATDRYRLYVHVNYKTVIADEQIGISTYPLPVVEGDKIEIHAYCQESLVVVTLENAWAPVVSDVGKTVSLIHIVPYD